MGRGGGELSPVVSVVVWVVVVVVVVAPTVAVVADGGVVVTVGADRPPRVERGGARQVSPILHAATERIRVYPL